MDLVLGTNEDMAVASWDWRVESRAEKRAVMILSTLPTQGTLCQDGNKWRWEVKWMKLYVHVHVAIHIHVCARVCVHYIHIYSVSCTCSSLKSSLAELTG